MNRTTYKIYTLGCKVNQYDSTDLNRKLAVAGFELVKNNARVAIINTCAVTKTAVHKCKRMVNKAKKENPGARVIIMGCWPKVYREDVEGLGAEIVSSQRDLLRILRTTRGSAKLPSSGYPLLGSLRARYFIKIQDGCEQFCSYCIIPYARGKLASRPESEVVEEVRQAVRGGYREIVLSGIHLGLYGKEVKSEKPVLSRAEGLEVRSDLSGLLKRLIGVRGLGRVRLSSIEVTEVGDDLLELIAKSHKICKHLHIPLQAGSDKILKLMNRPYSVKYYRNKISQIRTAMPDIAITTDVIVGFPGETNQDFLDTYKFVKEMKFSRLHVFPFSAHERTPAAKMPGRVSQEEIERRAKKLRVLGKKQEQEYRHGFKGRELDVVVERKKGTKYVGKTEYYFDVEFSGPQIITNNRRKFNNDNLIGRIVNVRI